MKYRSLATLVALFLGCSVGDPGGGGGTGGDGSMTGDSGGNGSDGGGGGGSDGGGNGSDSGNECAATMLEAEDRVAPVDIVFAIDNSGSMGEEMAFVREQIGNFVTIIRDSGIDARVVILTQPNTRWNISFENIGLPADTFRYVRADVQSNDGMTVLLEEYAQYSSFLRADATLNLILITDDDHTPQRGGQNALTPTQFRTMFEAQGKPFKFHIIGSPEGSTHVDADSGDTVPGCEGPNGQAVSNDEAYAALATATGGSAFSICSADWSAMFRMLAASVGVAVQIPCQFDLPTPPQGQSLDPARLNITYTPGGGAVETFPNAGTEDRCGTNRAWYYEGSASAPTGIRLCPAACEAVTSGAGSISVAAGCATQLI